MRFTTILTTPQSNGQRFFAVKQLEDALRTGRAMDAAPDGKAKLNARREQMSKTIKDSEAVNSEVLAKAAQDGKSKPLAAEDSEMSVVELTMVNEAFAKSQTWISKANEALNGNAIMGRDLKSIVASSEQVAISDAHKYSLGLRAVQRKLRGRDRKLAYSSRALQSFKNWTTGMAA